MTTPSPDAIGKGAFPPAVVGEIGEREIRSRPDVDDNQTGQPTPPRTRALEYLGVRGRMYVVRVVLAASGTRHSSQPSTGRARSCKGQTQCQYEEDEDHLGPPRQCNLARPGPQQPRTRQIRGTSLSPPAHVMTSPGRSATRDGHRRPSPPLPLNPNEGPWPIPGMLVQRLSLRGRPPP